MSRRRARWAPAPVLVALVPLLALLSACGPEAAAPAELLPWMLGYKSSRNDVYEPLEDRFANARILYVREDGTGYTTTTSSTTHTPVEDFFRMEAIPRSEDEFWVVRAEEQPRPLDPTIQEDEAWRFRRLRGVCGPFERVRVDRETGEPINGYAILWWPGKLCTESFQNCCEYHGDGESGCECTYFVWCEDGLPPAGCPGGPPVTSHDLP